MQSSMFSPAGRMKRSDYWGWVLVCFVANIEIIFFIGNTLSMYITDFAANLLLGIILIIQGVKRMHDVDKSGWYLLIPFYNLVLSLTDGTIGQNRYGEDPKDRSSQPESVMQQ